MTAEQQRWNRLRDEAQAFLPKDFARQLVRRAEKQHKAAPREYTLIAITAGVCLLSVVAANWYLGNRTQNQNLALWKVAEAQIRALRTSI
jgi:formate/nitrite transporter FocA (FNT family)